MPTVFLSFDLPRVGNGKSCWIQESGTYSEGFDPCRVQGHFIKIGRKLEFEECQITYDIKFRVEILVTPLERINLLKVKLQKQQKI
jgi:hypothetical protein